MEAARLLENYARLRDSLRQACARAGRKQEDVLLVAVSKFHPARAIDILAQAGQADFGENYLQEALAKREELDDLRGKARWHMIGHVQTRKAGQVAGAFTLLHTLDSIKLADALERHLLAKDAAQRALIEVNIAGEAQKAGVPASELAPLALHVLENCPHIELAGLMCLPPAFDAGDAARPFFARLRGLRDDLARETGLALPELSMGMSGDYQGAVLEGATIVRIGTDIFGPRPVKRP